MAAGHAVAGKPAHIPLAVAVDTSPMRNREGQVVPSLALRAGVSRAARNRVQ